jgi:hypothetical protein
MFKGMRQCHAHGKRDQKYGYNLENHHHAVPSELIPEMNRRRRGCSKFRKKA